jgi:hypothetical protein
MMDHLDDDRLHDYLDGTLDEHRWTLALRHLADCAPCRRRAFALGGLLRALRALPATSEPSPWVREAVVRDAAPRAAGFRSSRARAALLPLAAAVLLAAGFATGRSTGGSRGGDARAAGALAAAGESPAMAVQQWGTGYVGALAALSSDADRGRRGGEVAQGREAAFATLYAAAAELQRLAPQDPAAHALLRAASAARRQLLSAGARDTVQF